MNLEAAIFIFIYMYPTFLVELLIAEGSNAIEAVQKISDEAKRVIDLTVKNCGEVVMISCSNYFEGALSMEGDLPRTSKESGEHGYGLKSMRMLAKKYGGLLDFTSENNIFNLRIMLPAGKEKQLQLIA